MNCPHTESTNQIFWVFDLCETDAERDNGFRLLTPLPILRLCSPSFVSFESFMVKILPQASYLNSGMTFSANKRIFFKANSCGMPPK